MKRSLWFCTSLLLTLCLTLAPCALGEQAALSPEARAAYVAALDAWRNDLVLPDGTSLADFGDIDLAASAFALCDADGDGRVELLLQSVPGVSAGDALYVYDYDEQTAALRLELCEYPLVDFYDNGIATAGWSHNQGLSVDFWPYSLYRYDADADAYALVGMVDAWQKSFAPANYDGAAFPDEVDQSGAGMVYFVMEGGEYNTDHPVDTKAYEAWRDSFLADATKLDVGYLPLTAQNIAAVSK